MEPEETFVHTEQEETPKPAPKPKPIVTTPAPAKVAAPIPHAPKAPGVGKTIKSIAAYTLGGTHVVELQFTDNAAHFIKWKSGVCETGGTNQWDSGTKI